MGIITQILVIGWIKHMYSTIGILNLVVLICVGKVYLFTGISHVATYNFDNAIWSIKIDEFCSFFFMEDIKTIIKHPNFFYFNIFLIQMFFF